MAHIEESIEVDAPVTSVYNQWTQFEDFPRFMEGVKEVRQLDDKRLIWKAEIGGKNVEWTAEITQQEPDRRIGWRSTSGAVNAGSVTFEPLAPTRTKATLRLEYEPEGAGEKTGSALGLVKDHHVTMSSLEMAPHSLRAYRLSGGVLFVGGFAHGMYANGSWFPLAVVANVSER